MLPDFKLITHKFPDRPDIEIWPVFDVHLGATEHNAEAWAKFCKMVLGREKAYIVLGGDLINNATRSSVSNIFEETMSPSAQKKVIVEMLKPLADAGRLLCGVGGNHERRSEKDADYDPAYDIMCKLNCEELYRKTMAFVKIKMGEDKTAGDRNPCYILCVTHGAAGGAKYGSATNKAVDYAYTLSGVDCLIVGHTHKPFVTSPAQIVVDPQHGMAYVKPFYVVNATAWMNYGGYAAQKMLPPSSITPQVITLSGRKKQIKVTM